MNKFEMLNDVPTEVVEAFQREFNARGNEELLLVVNDPNPSPFDEGKIYRVATKKDKFGFTEFVVYKTCRVTNTGVETISGSYSTSANKIFDLMFAE